ncbi:unnamed protein product, partial [Owenia fusiformis]
MAEGGMDVPEITFKNPELVMNGDDDQRPHVALGSRPVSVSANSDSGMETMARCMKSDKYKPIETVVSAPNASLVDVTPLSMVNETGTQKDLISRKRLDFNRLNSTSMNNEHQNHGMVTMEQLNEEIGSLFELLEEQKKNIGQLGETGCLSSETGTKMLPFELMRSSSGEGNCSGTCKSSVQGINHSLAMGGIGKGMYNNSRDGKSNGSVRTSCESLGGLMKNPRFNDDMGGSNETPSSHDPGGSTGASSSQVLRGSMDTSSSQEALGTRETVEKQKLNVFNVPAGNGTCYNVKQADVVPDKFKGTSEVAWRDYQIHFETVAVINNWNDAQKVAHLAVNLRGDAQQLLGDMSTATRNNYSMMVDELSRRFDDICNIETFRVQLKNRMKKKEESYQEFG